MFTLWRSKNRWPAQKLASFCAFHTPVATTNASRSAVVVSKLLVFDVGVT